MASKKILIVDSILIVSDLIKNRLDLDQVEYSLRIVTDINNLEISLKDFKPDVVISDYNQNGFTCLEALSIVKKNFPNTSFVFLIDKYKEEYATPLIDKGALDYLLTDNLNRLNVVIKNSIYYKSSELTRDKQFKKSVVDSPVPIMIFDESDNVLLLSREWTNLSGYNIEDIPTLGDWTRLAYGTSNGTEKRLIDSLFKIDKTVNSGRCEIKTKNGSVRTWEFITTPLGKEVTGKRIIQSMALDITESMEATEQLRQSSHLLEMSQSIAKVGGWELDIITNNLFWTAETYLIHDTSPEEFSPTMENFIEYFIPDDRKILKEAIYEAVTEGIGYDLELETLTTKDRLIHVRTSCEVTKSKGKPIKLTGSFQDISKYKTEQIKIIESEKKFKSLYENAPLSYQSLNGDGSFKDVNPAWLKTLGYNREEVIGKNYEDFIHPKWKHHFKENFPIFKKRGYVNGIQYKIKHKDGHYLDILFDGCIGYNPDGTFKQTYCVFQDITKKKKIEEQLKQSEKMESIGLLSGGIAHDFNNMLSGIMGATQLIQIQQKNLSDNSLKYIDMILDSSTRAAELITKLMAFGGKKTVINNIFSIHDIIDEVSAIFNSTIDKSIHIKIFKDAINHNIDGDYSSIENVIMNLGINASHAMDSGGELIITTENVVIDQQSSAISSFDLMPGEYIHIKCKDSGSGIEHKHLNKIFDPFFTTKDVDQGTGLGLASVYRTIMDHKGSITVNSEVGVGTTFSILLPTNKDKISKQDQTCINMVQGSGLVLVVDDEEVIRESLKGLLEDVGYSVVTAKNGYEAVEIYTEKHTEIKLVILDMIMPGLKGSEVFYKLLNINKDCKVIISSGYMNDDSMQSLIKNGKVGFISKPYRVFELSHAISNI